MYQNIQKNIYFGILNYKCMLSFKKAKNIKNVYFSKVLFYFDWKLCKKKFKNFNRFWDNECCLIKE